MAGLLEATSWQREALRKAGAQGGAADLLNRGYGAIDALYAVGLLSDKQRRKWAQRLSHVADTTMPAATRTLSPPVIVAAKLPAARTENDVSGSRRSRHRLRAAQSFSGKALREVLVLDSSSPVGAPRIQLVELHDDGLVIDWIDIPPEVAEPQLHPRVAVYDDVGTEYTAWAGGSSGFGELTRTRSVFVPGIPGEATTLEVQFNEIRWLIPIAGRAAGE